MTMRTRLLLIEDSPDNLDILRLLLQDDFQIHAFTSPAEALEQIEQISPELLLLDIAMPGIDGIECLQRIRSMPRFSGTPAIAVTAFAYPEERRKFLAAGFQAVVVKPIIDQEELLKTIEEALIGVSESRLEQAN